MGSYVKFTHQKKKWWWPRLKMCIEGCTDSLVVIFAKKALKNLIGLLDNDFYTALYIGESIGFHKRMTNKDPS